MGDCGVISDPVLPVTLDDIEAARRRLMGRVRRTPLIAAAPVRQRWPGPAELFLKLEHLQIVGSFKARGAVNKLLSLPLEAVARGLVTASGGNHGLGVAYAGWLAQVPTTIYLPRSTPSAKAASLAAWGARAVVEGDAWDDANRAALAVAEADGGPTYIHPFADPVVIAGQGTIGLEIVEDLPDVDVLVVAIGGGGLISGVAVAASALRPSIRVIGVEPTGAPTLYESLREGRLVELPRITTAAGTLAPRRSSAINLDTIRQTVEKIVLVSDDDMRAAARWLWDELHVPVELSGAAAVAAVLTGRVRAGNERVCALVCGAGTDGLPEAALAKDGMAT
jgi:threonine dehydratase